MAAVATGEGGRMISRRRVWGAFTLAFLALAVFSWRTYRAYNAAEPTPGEKLIPARVQGKYGFINAAGAMVIPPRWDKAKVDAGGELLWVVRDGLHGWLDGRGVEVIPCKWEESLGFEDRSFAPVMLEEQWGALDRKGVVVAPMETRSEQPRHTPTREWATRARIGSDRDRLKFMRVNGDGLDELPKECDRIREFDSEGMAIIESDQGYGWIDRQGRVRVKPVFDDVRPFDAKGMARVRNGVLRWGWIDRRGERKLECRWTESLDFGPNDLAFVKNETGARWIDREGKEVLAGEWTDGLSFDEHGWAAAEKDGRWGWINAKGEPVLPFAWSTAWPFDENGLAIVGAEPDEEGVLKYGLIDRRGTTIQPAIWAFLRHDGDGRYTANKTNGDETLISRSGVAIYSGTWFGFPDKNGVTECHSDLHPVLQSSPSAAEWLNRFNLELSFLIDSDGQTIWRSDFYLLSRLMPAVGAFCLLLAGFSAWRWKRAGRMPTTVTGAA